MQWQWDNQTNAFPLTNSFGIFNEVSFDDLKCVQNQILFGRMKNQAAHVKIDCLIGTIGVIAPIQTNKRTNKRHSTEFNSH